jgi:hypothetical protein
MFTIYNLKLSIYQLKEVKGKDFSPTNASSLALYSIEYNSATSSSHIVNH